MKPRELRAIAIILLGAVVLCLASCTKTYTPSTFWDVKIQRNVDTLTAVAYNSKSTALRYLWIVNQARTDGNVYVLKPGRSEVQLVVFDDKGGSVAEYVTIAK
jgi:hypothetical protein